MLPKVSSVRRRPRPRLAALSLHVGRSVAGESPVLRSQQACTRVLRKVEFARFSPRSARLFPCGMRSMLHHDRLKKSEGASVILAMPFHLLLAIRTHHPRIQRAMSGSWCAVCARHAGHNPDAWRRARTDRRRRRGRRHLRPSQPPRAAPRRASDDAVSDGLGTCTAESSAAAAMT